MLTALIPCGVFAEELDAQDSVPYLHDIADAPSMTDNDYITYMEAFTEDVQGTVDDKPAEAHILDAEHVTINSVMPMSRQTLAVPTGRTAVFHLSDYNLTGISHVGEIDGIQAAGDDTGTFTIEPDGSIRVATALTEYAGASQGIDVVPEQFGGLQAGDEIQVLIQLVEIVDSPQIARSPVNNGFRIESAVGHEQPAAGMTPAANVFDWQQTPLGHRIAVGAAPTLFTVPVTQAFIAANNNEWEWVESEGQRRIIGNAEPPRFRIAPNIVTAWIDNDGFDGLGGSVFVIHDILIHSERAPQVTYTVNFALNGGTHTGGGQLAQQVEAGGAATPPTVTRGGWKLAGWTSNPSGIAMNNITADVTFTAQWVEASVERDFIISPIAYMVGDRIALDFNFERKNEWRFGNFDYFALDLDFDPRLNLVDMTLGKGFFTGLGSGQTGINNLLLFADNNLGTLRDFALDSESSDTSGTAVTMFFEFAGANVSIEELLPSFVISNYNFIINFAYIPSTAISILPTVVREPQGLTAEEAIVAGNAARSAVLALIPQAPLASNFGVAQAAILQNSINALNSAHPDIGIIASVNIRGVSPNRVLEVNVDFWVESAMLPDVTAPDIPFISMAVASTTQPTPTTPPQPTPQAPPAITVTQGFARPGETTQVGIRLDRNPGFAGMFLRVELPEGLTLVSYDVTDPELANGISMAQVGGNVNIAPNETANITGAFFVGWVCDTDFTAQTGILMLNLLVDSNAENGNLPINVTLANATGDNIPTNADGETLDVTVRQGGGVTVRTEIKNADANGDNRITSADGVIIARYIVGHVVTIDKEAADLNGDGKVDTLDLTILGRWLVGIESPS